MSLTLYMDIIFKALKRVLKQLKTFLHVWVVELYTVCASYFSRRKVKLNLQFNPFNADPVKALHFAILV